MSNVVRVGRRVRDVIDVRARVLRRPSEAGVMRLILSMAPMRWSNRAVDMATMSPSVPMAPALTVLGVCFTTDCEREDGGASW